LHIGSSEKQIRMNQFNWSAWLVLALMSIGLCVLASCAWKGKLPSRYFRNFDSNQSQIRVYRRSLAAILPAAAASVAVVVSRLAEHGRHVIADRTLRLIVGAVYDIDLVVMIISLALLLTLFLMGWPKVLIPPPFRNR
jgi:hypothetical protein